MGADVASGALLGKAELVTTDIAGFLRHIEACNNAVLPGARLPLLIGAARVGFVTPEVAAALRRASGADAEAAALVLRDPRPARSHRPRVGRAGSDALAQ